MRKLTFTLLAFGSISLGMAQVPNGDMETWITRQWSNPPGGSGTSYYDLGNDTVRDGDFLRSLNEINDLPFPLTAPLTCFRSDTAHGGNYSARLKTGTFGSIIIPGFLGTGDVDIVAQNIALGRPYTQRPDRFRAYYLYAPVNGDSAAFEVIFYQASSIIGYGKQVITTATSGTTWATADFWISWTGSGNPDSVAIIAASSGGYDLNNVLGGVGQAGSTLWVDDISLEFGGVGVEEELISEHVHIYPNPASQIITVNTESLPTNLTLRVFDMNGKAVIDQVLNSNNAMIDISALKSGNYVVVLQNSMNLIHRSKLIKE